MRRSSLAFFMAAVCACSSGGQGPDLPAAVVRQPPSQDPTLLGNGENAPPENSPPVPERPTYGPTIELADPPPAASGGTLAVSNDGSIAVVADPDRDSIYVVDLANQKLKATIGLLPHDEPGRVVIDGSGRAHVALRRGGALVTIDLSTFVSMRRSVCTAPRGVAWDANSDVVHVACNTGELVTFPASGGSPVRTVKIERDLRDVIVAGGQLYVTTFKKAELLSLDADGNVVKRAQPNVNKFKMFAAFRTILAPNGDIWMLHQGTAGSLAIQPGGYGSECGAAIIVTVTVFAPNAPPHSISIGDAVLAQDIAVAPKRNTTVQAAIPILGNAHAFSLPKHLLFDPRVSHVGEGCGGWGGGPPPAPDL
jgi:hypothetical protein